MGKKNSLDQCRTTREFVAYSKHHKGTVARTNDHIIVRGPRGGICPLPNHPGDLATGTRHSIVKMLLAILGALILSCTIAAQIIPIGG